MTDLSHNLLFEKFEILECLKKDAHSSVYIANHIYLGKKIFLKTLNTRNLPDQSILSRFKREAKILARLDHPNIIKVLDFGTYQHHFYISFEYFESRNLRDPIRSNQLDVARKIDLTRQILEGLSFAHQNQIIHRDVKPENILIDDEYQLKIADFGLAVILNEDQVTQKSTLVGTAGYMSPEQVGGGVLSAQSDIFSAGIVIYELFSGKNPFIGKDLGETINNILKVDLQKLLEQNTELPEEIRLILNRMLVRDRNQRAATVQEVLNELNPQIEFTATAGNHDSKRRTISRWAMLGGLVLLISIGGLLVYNYRSLDESNLGTMSYGSKSEERRGKSEERGGENVERRGKSKERRVIDAGREGESGQDSKPDGLMSHQAKNSAGIPPSQTNNRASRTESIARRTVSGSTEKVRPNEPDTLPLPGKLFVRTRPSSNIFIDSIRMGETPLQKPIELAPGEYQLGLVNANFPGHQQSLKIQSEQTVNFSVDFDTLFGYLDCQIYPWAEITIDGEPRGQTPLLHPIAISPGNHQLSVKNPRFETFETEITITRKDTLRYQLNLENLADRQGD